MKPRSSLPSSASRSSRSAATGLVLEPTHPADRAVRPRPGTPTRPATPLAADPPASTGWSTSTRGGRRGTAWTSTPAPRARGSSRTAGSWPSNRPAVRWPFRDPANMARLGYLPQRPSPCNPDGLPVGFVRDPPATASTSTGSGSPVPPATPPNSTTRDRLPDRRRAGDGRPADAARRADRRPEGHARRPGQVRSVRAAVLGGARTGRDELEDATRRRCAGRRAEYEPLNRTPHPYGPARLDAFGRIVNRYSSTALGVTDPSQRQAAGRPGQLPVPVGHPAPRLRPVERGRPEQGSRQRRRSAGWPGTSARCSACSAR